MMHLRYNLYHLPLSLERGERREQVMWEVMEWGVREWAVGSVGCGVCFGKKMNKILNTVSID
jgi:hypothetical protein